MVLKNSYERRIIILNKEFKYTLIKSKKIN